MCILFIRAEALVRLIIEPKLWVRLSQGVLARRTSESTDAEILKIRTSSYYFQHIGVCDSAAACEVE